MILAGGKIYDTNEQESLLESLGERINNTLCKQNLTAETVISALERLGIAAENGEFNALAAGLEIEGVERYISIAAQALRRENIEYKLKVELGTDFFDETQTNPPFNQPKLKIKPMPLGTILHIAAGNVDGLPAFSVAEGLLTGNVNILKLPQADNGISVEILRRLVEIEPKLADFIYAFDTPSTDVIAMKKMAELSDGIVVWGGEAAVAAIRRLAPVGAKIIEWGHKLGFAYISGFEDKKAELEGLARHIVTTKQLLCSSCQVVYLDTDDKAELESFCAEFLPILDKAAMDFGSRTIGEEAETSLRRYYKRIEAALTGTPNSNVLQGERTSLTICDDSVLELSDMFGNCLVKALPREKLFAELRNAKGFLQTAGLICEKAKRDELSEMLAKSGVTRIMRAGNMSEVFFGEAHDGEYPMRRYVRIVNVE